MESQLSSISDNDPSAVIGASTNSWNALTWENSVGGNMPMKASPLGFLIKELRTLEKVDFFKILSFFPFHK